MIELSLKNRTAIVGGASQGIGKAVAKELADLGANVVLLARNEDALKAAVSELRTESWQKHTAVRADYSNPSMLLAEIENFALRYEQPVHIIINNTGGPTPGPANSAHSDEFLAAFKQHLICNHVIMQAFLPGMKEANYGRIINIISTSVKSPLPNLGVSNTIRAAVANWAKTLANELGPYGITVNNVLPGATHTGRLETIIKNKAAKTETGEENIEKEMLSEIPLGRFARPEEIAYAVAFLAGPSASYINGINLPVDGGRLSCM